jgi:hypothetical protein
MLEGLAMNPCSNYEHRFRGYPARFVLSKANFGFFISLRFKRSEEFLGLLDRDFSRISDFRLAILKSPDPCGNSLFSLVPANSQDTIFDGF